MTRATRHTAPPPGIRRQGTVVLALCLLATLPSADATEPLVVFEESERCLGLAEKMEPRFLLWKATGNHDRLLEAKRLLDHLIEHVPEEYRESMLTNVRLNREIMEAWEEHGEKAVGEGDGE